MKKFILAPLLLLIFVFTAGAAEPVRNVIFMIGDGMGLAQFQIAMMHSSEPLSMERAQYIGLQKTYSANNRVTDSGAAGTALATGTKTKNSMLGVDPDGQPLTNITEIAQQMGKATGMVVTVSLTHATPAAFMVHTPHRKAYDQIALDVAASGVDVLIGGGRRYFEKREDGIDLSARMRGQGYSVVYNLDEAQKAKEGKLAVLATDKHMKGITKGRGDFLPQGTAIALDRLALSENGFFLMVEGSQIDFAGHSNDAHQMIGETLEFDRAVAVAYDFADANPGTLVIVTGDHETGGVIVPSGNEDFLLPDQGVQIKFGSCSHTAIMVPIYAYGAGAENFTTIMENTDIFHKLVKLMKGE